jgi:excisionase family DNA binding protein
VGTSIPNRFTGRRHHRKVLEALLKPTCPIYGLGEGRAVAMAKEYVNIEELSEYLGIKKSTLYGMVEKGELPHYRIGRLIRFKRDDMDSWIERHRREIVVPEKRATEIMKKVKNRTIDVDRIVKKAIEGVKNRGYNRGDGKSDRIRGLGKEASHGTL